MKADQFNSVWDAIEDTPEQAENMRLRADLMQTLRQHIQDNGWSQTDAATRLGVTQPRVSDLVRGKISLFSLDSLIRMAVSAGLHVSITIGKAA
jgi:predicted XRE-type DNA-binding protein